MPKNEDAKIMDELDKDEENILICMLGTAPSDLQVNGVCSECGRGIYFQATAPKELTNRVCIECLPKLVREFDEAPKFRMMRTALTEATKTIRSRGVEIKDEEELFRSTMREVQRRIRDDEDLLE